MKRALILLTVFAAACGSNTTPSNQPPTGGSIAVKPISAGLVTATTFTLTANGVTDPNNDTITYAWDFGDGTTGAGQVVTKTYSTAGAFTVKLSASDGHNPAVAAAQTSLTIRSLTATFGGTLTCSTCSGATASRTVAINLTQAGLSLSGTCTDSTNSSPAQAIQVQTFAIDTTTGLFNFSGSCGAGFELFGMKYDPGADTFAVSNWDSPAATGTLTRK